MTTSAKSLLVRNLLNRAAKSRKQGFTLIELLVVVVIIGILASMALPSFLGAQDKAKNASVAANVKTVQMGIEEYATDFNGVFPVAGNWITNATTGLLQSTVKYLPGGKMPKTPWGTGNQAGHIAVPANATMPGAVSVGNNTPMPASGSLLSAGVRSDAPTATFHYGAIAYDYDPDSQVYVLYGAGKKSKQAILAARSSNSGN